MADKGAEPVSETSAIYTKLQALHRSSCIASAEQSLRASYHLAPPFTSMVSRSSTVLHFGYAEDTISKYLSPEIFENDPVPDIVIKVGKKLKWSEATGTVKLSKGQRKFLRSAVQLGFVDGFAIPLFGPHGRNGVFTLNFGREIRKSDEVSIERIASDARSTHLSICELLENQTGATSQLSPRELEVVYWVSRGKSSQDIGTILGISHGTVTTYMKRIFAKTGVNDRMSVVIKCLSEGMLIY